MLTCRSVQFRSARVSIFCRGGIASSPYRSEPLLPLQPRVCGTANARHANFRIRQISLYDCSAAAGVAFDFRLEGAPLSFRPFAASQFF